MSEKMIKFIEQVNDLPMKLESSYDTLASTCEMMRLEYCRGNCC